MAIDTSPLATGPNELDKPRGWPWVLGLILLAVAVFGVGVILVNRGSDDATSATDSTAPGVLGEDRPGTVAGGSDAAEADADIIKAYQDASAATLLALEDISVGPDDPALAETMVDPLLNYVRQQITDLHSRGIYYEPGGITVVNLHVVERGADRALVRLCRIDASYGYNAKGERVPAPGLPGKREVLEGIAVRDGSGTWKISSRYPIDGGTECDGV